MKNPKLESGDYADLVKALKKVINKTQSAHTCGGGLWFFLWFYLNVVVVCGDNTCEQKITSWNSGGSNSICSLLTILRNLS